VEQAVSDQPARRGQPAIMRVQDVVDFLKLPSVQTVQSWIKKGWAAVLLGWPPDPLSTQGGVEVVRGAHRAICTLWQ
jgi:hypothetical protein